MTKLNVILTRNLKQALNHGLALKKLHRITKFKQKALLNTDLRKKNKKMILKKTFLSWRIMQFLKKLWEMWETMEILNLSQQKGEPNYHTHRKFISNRNELQINN